MNSITKSWFTNVIDLRAILTPFSRVKRYVAHENGHITYNFTYHDYFVFGVRIARIHQ